MNELKIVPGFYWVKSAPKAPWEMIRWNGMAAQHFGHGAVSMGKDIEGWEWNLEAIQAP